VSNLDTYLDLFLFYSQSFCREQLFLDQKSGIFQLERSELHDPARIDRLLLVVAIADLVSSLKGFDVSFDALCRQVDPPWRRGLSFVPMGLATLQTVYLQCQDHSPGLVATPAPGTGTTYPKL
jgi:hypothetical protein